MIRRTGRIGATREGRAGRLLAAVAVAAALAGCAGRGPSLHRVTIRAFRFEPAVLSAAVGDTVEWRNRDIVPHTATARNRSWDTGNIPADSAGRVVLRAPGRQLYGCLYHTEMQARIEVR